MNWTFQSALFKFSAISHINAVRLASCIKALIHFFCEVLALVLRFSVNLKVIKTIRFIYHWGKSTMAFGWWAAGRTENSIPERTADRVLISNSVQIENFFRRHSYEGISWKWECLSCKGYKFEHDLVGRKHLFWIRTSHSYKNCFFLAPALFQFAQKASYLDLHFTVVKLLFIHWILWLVSKRSPCCFSLCPRNIAVFPPKIFLSSPGETQKRI